jgi:hypothetical protein
LCTLLTQLVEHARVVLRLFLQLLELLLLSGLTLVSRLVRHTLSAQVSRLCIQLLMQQLLHVPEQLVVRGCYDICHEGRGELRSGIRGAEGSGNALYFSAHITQLLEHVALEVGVLPTRGSKELGVVVAELAKGLNLLWGKGGGVEGWEGVC